MAMHGERTECLDERAHAGNGPSWEAVMEGISAVLLLQSPFRMCRSYCGDEGRKLALLKGQL